MIRFLALAARRRLPRRAFGPSLFVPGPVAGGLFGPRGSRFGGSAAGALPVALFGGRAGGRAARGPRRLASFPAPGAGRFRPGPARPPRPAPRRR